MFSAPQLDAKDALEPCNRHNITPGSTLEKIHDGLRAELGIASHLSDRPLANANAESPRHPSGQAGLSRSPLHESTIRPHT